MRQVSHENRQAIRSENISEQFMVVFIFLLDSRS